MNCAEASRFVHACLDGELVEDEREAFDGHVRDCERCRRVTEAERRLKTGLRAAFADPEPLPAGLADRVRARLADEARARASRRWVPAVTFGALAAAAGLALWIGGGTGGTAPVAHAPSLPAADRWGPEPPAAAPAAPAAPAVLASRAGEARSRPAVARDRVTARDRVPRESAAPVARPWFPPAAPVAAAPAFEPRMGGATLVPVGGGPGGAYPWSPRAASPAGAPGAAAAGIEVARPWDDPPDVEEMIAAAVRAHHLADTVQVTGQSGAVERWFRDEVPVAVRAPRLPGARLAGGRLSRLGRLPAAQLVYVLGGGRRLSVFVFDPHGMRLPADRTRIVGDGQLVAVGQQRGYSVAVTYRLGAGYSFASDLEDRELLRLVQAAFGRAR